MDTNLLDLTPAPQDMIDPPLTDMLWAEIDLYALYGEAPEQKTPPGDRLAA